MSSLIFWAAFGTKECSDICSLIVRLFDYQKVMIAYKNNMYKTGTAMLALGHCVPK